MTTCPTDEILDTLQVPHCPRCRPRFEERRALAAALRSLPLASERAPATLAATLRGLSAGAEAEAPRRASWYRRGLVSGVAAVACLSFLLLPESGPVPNALADEAISSHLHALARDGACEVESQDAWYLNNWLTEALGTEVEVPEAPEGGTLVGARRCSLFGEKAAAVVYRKDGASVTVFLPAPGTTAAAACEGALGTCNESRDGQTVCVVPDHGGSPRVVVGDLPADRLCSVGT